MRLAHCRASRRGSPNRTDTGGSALPGERVFVPPHLPLAIPVGIGSGGWKPVTPEQVTIMPSGAILRRDYNPPDRLDNAFSGFGLTRLPSGGREFRRHHFSHHEFLYFAGDRHRIGIDEPHIARNLEMRDLPAAKATNILLGRDTAILQSDPGAQLLTVMLVRHAEYATEGCLNRNSSISRG